MPLGTLMESKWDPKLLLTRKQKGYGMGHHFLDWMHCAQRTQQTRPTPCCVVAVDYAAAAAAVVVAAAAAESLQACGHLEEEEDHPTVATLTLGGDELEAWNGQLVL